MPTKPTGPVVVDASTVLAAGGGQLPRLPTKTVFFKGPQTAGVLLSFTITEDCHLVFVGGKASSAILQTIARAMSSVPASTFTLSGVICSINDSGQVAIMNQPFKAGDKIYVDSIGGLGANEIFYLIFEIDVPV